MVLPADRLNAFLDAAVTPGGVAGVAVVTKNSGAPAVATWLQPGLHAPETHRRGRRRDPLRAARAGPDRSPARPGPHAGRPVRAGPARSRPGPVVSRRHRREAARRPGRVSPRWVAHGVLASTPSEVVVYARDGRPRRTASVAPSGLRLGPDG